MAWNFYGLNATAFTRDFGLMPSLVAGSGYKGVAKSIFLGKLSAIHDMVLRKQMDNAKKKPSGENPAVTIEGSENG